jgi:kexin
MIKMFYTLYIVLFLSLFGCNGSVTKENTDRYYTNAIYLNEASSYKLLLYQDKVLIASSKSGPFDAYYGSQFSFKLDPSIDDLTDLTLKVEDINITLNIKVQNIRDENFFITELTFLQENYDLEHNQTLASLLLKRDVNGDGKIDRDDILEVSSRDKTPLVQPNLFDSLSKNGFTDAILQDENLSLLYEEDSDSDTLARLEEVLHGSSDYNIDSDGDGLLDMQEVVLGTFLYLKDSDTDGLDDRNETLLGTSPTLYDSDGDFIGDYVEILNATDPLQWDENGDGVKDGIDRDPLLFLQWHLKSNGDEVSNTNGVSTIVGNDLDIFRVNAKVQTHFTQPKIQVIDTGVEALHEDLNVDLILSSNAINGSNDPTPTERVTGDKSDPLRIGHGTAVAGIIGAKVQNSLGVRGIVDGAVIVGSNWLEDGGIEKLDALWYNSDAARESAISNNSWGGYYVNDSSFEQIMKLATEQLRGGKGRIFVVPSGNEREEFGNANLSTLANNPYVFTVAALNHKNEFTFYSNAGSNVLVSAYGGERYYEAPTIATTLLMGKSYYASELDGFKGAITDDADLQRNYTYGMNGTSAATPMVSASLALVLDACPELSWRDLKYMVAKTAKKIDTNSSEWFENAAGLWHNNNYGFGLINPDAMVDMCRLGHYTLLPPVKIVSSQELELNYEIPDDNSVISFELEIKEPLLIEWVGLDFKSNHTYSGDLNIALISPSGTKSLLVSSNDVKFDGYTEGFRFSSIFFMDENSRGLWRVEVRDAFAKDSGILNSLKLTIRGH